MDNLTAIDLLDLRLLLLDHLSGLLFLLLATLLRLFIFLATNLAPYRVFRESFLVHLNDGLLLFHLSENCGSAGNHV